MIRWTCCAPTAAKPTSCWRSFPTSSAAVPPASPSFYRPPPHRGRSDGSSSSTLGSSAFLTTSTPWLRSLVISPSAVQAGASLGATGRTSYTSSRMAGLITDGAALDPPTPLHTRVCIDHGSPHRHSRSDLLHTPELARTY